MFQPKPNPKPKSRKFNTELCDDSMTFQECELAILRHAVDETEQLQLSKMASSEEIKRIIAVLEDFLRRRECICYGGTAINNILPKFAQFYNRDLEIPDYDFYSKTPLEDAKALADIYFKAGYEEIEAKSGVHHGTYKVFVNFIPIADITYLDPEIFDTMKPEAIKVAGIYYASPNFLRMNMFLELSRPAGDVSRWEKVLKRMTLLNKFYPVNPELECSMVEFQRSMSTASRRGDLENQSQKIYYIVRNTLIDQGVVFFGGYAASLYSKYMPKNQQRLIRAIPDFDVISEDANTCALILKEQLEQAGFRHVEQILHPAIGELIPEHIEIRVERDTLVFIYRPIACHNYNKIQLGYNEIKIATIDTMLTFYFAFYYTRQPYYNKDRILCMIKFLFDVEQKNRLAQKGLLKRFSIDCYGKQTTLESIRAEKTEKFKELKNNRTSREYEEWFLKYNPTAVKSNANPTKVNATPKKKTTKKAEKRGLAAVLSVLRRKTSRKNEKSASFLNAF